MGDTVVVNCIVSKGDLPIDIHWVLNTAPIIAGENGVAIVKLNQRTSTLSISSVEGMHRGAFKCLASNRAGEAEYSVELHVNGLFLLIGSNTSHIRRIFF